jgi:hypothetical protein
MMTNSKILGLVIVIASILVASPFAMQSASAGLIDMMDCSTDKFNPTIGDLSSYTIVIANAGDNCYLGQYGETTEVLGVNLEDAGKVNVVNTEIGYLGTEIDGTTDYVKFKDNELHANALISNNDVTHLEVMDNYLFTGYTTPEISIQQNTANILKIVGNSISVSMKDNTIDFFAFCKNNTDVHSWDENTYNGKNKGCP